VLARASKRGDLFVLALVLPLAFVAGALIYSGARARPPAGDVGDEAAVEADAERAPDVSERLRAAVPDLESCYRQATSADPSLGRGELLVRLGIASSGKVKDVSIETALESAALDRCVREAAARWTFPVSREAYGVQFPVVLQQ
jgi:TonB family protein